MIVFIFFCAIVTGEGKEVEYRTSILSNGMRVIMKENHDNPLVASLVYVHAGSAFEKKWNNGVSHLLEHLLFDGTRERSREDINEGVKDLGGYINAFTRELYTSFIVLVPAENIGEGLMLQRDMLFHSIIPDEELTKERKVVIEEIRKDESTAYYIAERFHRDRLYAGNPYALPVIGYPNVISTVTRDEILDYYSSYYVPNNMTILLMGDFDQDRMLELIQSTFGDVPYKPLPPRVSLEMNPPDESYMATKEGDTRISYMTVSFICPDPHHKDYNALDLLSRYLSEGEDSPLQRSLVRGNVPVAMSASSGMTMRDGFSVFDFNILFSGNDPEKIIDKLRGMIKQVSHIKPDRERLEELKTGLLVSEVITQEKFHYFGIMMADEIAVGGIDNLLNRRKMIQDVSPADVAAVASRYLDGAGFYATAYVPGGKDLDEQEDRNRKETVRKVLPNGLVLLIESSDGSDVFAMNVFARGRSHYEPSDRQGSSEILSRLFLRGTDSRNFETLAQDLRSIGAQVTVVDNPMIPYDDRYTTPAYSFLRFQTLGKYHEEAIELISDMLRNPSLDDSEIELVREEVKGLIQRDGKSSYKEGRALLMETMFENHPFEHRIVGQIDHVSRITRMDLSSFHEKLYSPGNLIVSVVTSLPIDVTEKKLGEALGGSWGSGETFGEYPAPSPVDEIKEVMVDMKSNQAYLYFGFPLPGARDPRAPDIIIMNSILSARLGLSLREQEGLAYSVGSSVRFDRNFGYLVISMGTAGESVEPAKEGILAQIADLSRDGITEKELSRAVSDYRGDLLRKRMSRLNKAYYMALNEYLGWVGEDSIYNSMQELTVQDVDSAARDYLSNNPYVLVVVK